MSDALSGLLLTEPVVAALRLAGSRRRAGGGLDTQTLLLALESVDVSSAWSRFVITERPQDEPAAGSVHTWDGIPLTPKCAEALRRARVLAEKYDLRPLPPGALALALVWDAESAAAQSFVGVTHEELIAAVQQELIGLDLEGLDDALADRRTHLLPGVPPVLPARARIPRAQPSELHKTRTAPKVGEDEARRAMARVTALLPLWVLRLIVAAALCGIAISLATSAVWTFRPKDDLAPPIPRPAVAAAIPDDATMSKLLDTRLVRIMDGLPSNIKIFDSMLPFAYDYRTQVVDSAWAATWESADGKSQAVVSLVRLRSQNLPVAAANDCVPEPSGAVAAKPPVIRRGYVSHSAKGGEYCSLIFDKQTQVFVGVLTADPSVLAAVVSGVQAITDDVQHALPSPPFSPVRTVATPYTSATVNRGILLAAVAVPMLWAIPTLMFDRASWQRLWGTLSLKRVRSLPLPGLDIDRAVRGRLWSATALACFQVLAVIWGLRLTTYQRLPVTSAAVIAAILVTSAIPRLTYLRRAGRSQVFAGHRRLLLLVGTVVAVVAVVGVGLLMVALGALASIGSGDSTPDYILQRTVLLFQLLLIPATLLAIVPAMLLRRIAMRILRTQPMADGRPPVLLLRSFADDSRRLRARSGHRRALVDRLSLRRWERFEEVIAASLGMRRTVFAVGQEGERLPPPLGAVRRQFSSEEWREKVPVLMADASLICVSLGRSTNLTWEIRRIANSGHLGKTIFVVPPTSRREHLKRLAVLAAELNLEWADLNVALSGSWALAVRVAEVGAQPLVIRARAQEDVGYDIALELASLVVAGFELSTPSLADELRLPRPVPEIHSPGKAPVFKSILRRKTTWLALALSSSSIVSLPFVFLAGEPDNTSTAITLRAGYSWWATAADPKGSAVYGVLNGVGLERLDFAKKPGTQVCRIEVADNLIAGDEWLYASNQATGTLQAIDPTAKRVMWTLRGLVGVRGVVEAGDAVYFLLPDSKQVRAVDRRSGTTIRTVGVAGTPWESAQDGRHIYVSVIDSAAVIELAQRTLAQTARFPTGKIPSRVVVADGVVWVYSAGQHNVTALTGPVRGVTIRTRSQNPHLATNGTVLAIEGVEQVTTMGPDHLLHRNRLSTRHAGSLSVTGKGDVVAISDDEALLIRASKHH